MSDVITRRDRLNPDEKKALRRIVAHRDSEALDISYDAALRIAEIESQTDVYNAQLSALIDEPDAAKETEIKAALAKLKKEKAALMGQASGSKERTEAQQRQVNLIEKVRELMQRELDTTWPAGQRGLKMHVIKHHYPELQRIYSHGATAETMAGKTKPSACKNLGVPQLPT